MEETTKEMMTTKETNNVDYLFDFDVDENKLRILLKYLVDWKSIKNECPRAFDTLRGFSLLYKPKNNLFFPLEQTIKVKINDEIFDIYQSFSIVNNLFKELGLLVYTYKGDSEYWRYAIKAINPNYELNVWLLFDSRSISTKGRFDSRSMAEIRAVEKALTFVEKILNGEIEWKTREFCLTHSIEGEKLSNIDNNISYFVDDVNI